mmetsp:Transcript_7011/g.20260  ORF Transcript_7011/g.20260 Transcript_7011/m.20260 type:complete len:230 (-) Transcript_7011:176-865(-)
MGRSSRTWTTVSSFAFGGHPCSERTKSTLSGRMRQGCLPTFCSGAKPRRGSGTGCSAPSRRSESRRGQLPSAALTTNLSSPRTTSGLWQSWSAAVWIRASSATSSHMWISTTMESCHLTRWSRDFSMRSLKMRANETSSSASTSTTLLRRHRAAWRKRRKSLISSLAGLATPSERHSSSLETSFLNTPPPPPPTTGVHSKPLKAGQQPPPRRRMKDETKKGVDGFSTHE